MNQKPTLVQLLNHHHVTMAHIAKAAQVQRNTVYAMVQGRPVPLSLARQVLAGLSRLAGVTYRLQDIQITIFE
jgi:hypothetical protein